jgi:predicted nucleic acid-binding protein
VFHGEAQGFVSNQILAELFVAITQRVGKPLSKERAGKIIRSFVDSPKWGKVNYDGSTVSRAAADSAATRNHFWELLIAETMRDGGLKRIYTENVGDFKGIPWVEAVNPLGKVREKGGARRPLSAPSLRE